MAGTSNHDETTPEQDKAAARRRRPAGAAARKGGAKKAKANSKGKASIDPAALVEKALRGIAGRLETDELKPTVTDLIRLLQLRGEIENETPKEIKVTWVEPGSASEK